MVAPDFLVERNVAAQAFWRRVISRYTGDRFEERVVEGRPVQLFDTRAAGRSPWDDRSGRSAVARER